MNFIHVYIFFEKLNFHEHGGSLGLLRKLMEYLLGGKRMILPFNQTYLDKRPSEIAQTSRELEQLNITTNGSKLYIF